MFRAISKGRPMTLRVVPIHRQRRFDIPICVADFETYSVFILSQSCSHFEYFSSLQYFNTIRYSKPITVSFSFFIQEHTRSSAAKEAAAIIWF